MGIFFPSWKLLPFIIFYPKKPEKTQLWKNGERKSTNEYYASEKRQISHWKSVMKKKQMNYAGQIRWEKVILNS